MKRFNNLIPVFFAGLLLFACTGNQVQESNNVTTAPTTVSGQSTISDEVSDPNIVQVALGSADHTTLVAAVKAAGLVDVLSNNGPLTVFAPTNAAFDALPEGTVESLMLPENKITLMGIIHYHAAPGTYQGDLLKDGMNLYMAQGDNVKIERRDGEIYANGAKILATIPATNGVVHVVDKVLLPPEK